jgi:hypothetical protein
MPYFPLAHSIPTVEIKVVGVAAFYSRAFPAILKKDTGIEVINRKIFTNYHSVFRINTQLSLHTGTYA